QRTSVLPPCSETMLLNFDCCMEQLSPLVSVWLYCFSPGCEMPCCTLTCFLMTGSPAVTISLLPTKFCNSLFAQSSIPRLSDVVLFPVEPVVKPKPTKRGGEKNASKSRRKKNRGKNKKKGTPCEMEYKNFCIHGECIYLEHLQMVTCKCHQDFFGERCGEQFMKTQRKNDVADYSKTVLVVVAVLLSSISFITVLIIVIVHYSAAEHKQEVEEECLC
uniref:Amphiregulin n=1 Tax=Amazona collaria TaxID=241587 RepID=A0A8B9F434_9PSIT